MHVMDKEAFAAEDGMGAGPGGEAAPTVVGLEGGAVREIDATVFAGEDGGEAGFGVVLEDRMKRALLQARKRLD